MKFVLLRHMTYMWIAISIIGGVSAAVNWLEGKGNINLLWVVVNAIVAWIWIRSSFEYFVWKKEKQEKSKSGS